jgi:hypothetical protein
VYFAEVQIVSAGEPVLLGELPLEHPLRNTPLAKMGAEYQWEQTKRQEEWHLVTAHFRIAKNTFNELGATWTRSYRWRANERTDG